MKRGIYAGDIWGSRKDGNTVGYLKSSLKKSTQESLIGRRTKRVHQLVRRLYLMRRLADYHDTVLSNSVDATREVRDYVLKVKELLKKLSEMDHGAD